MLTHFADYYISSVQHCIDRQRTANQRMAFGIPLTMRPGY